MGCNSNTSQYHPTLPCRNPTITVPVIEFEGVRYDRFMELIKAVHGDRAQSLVDEWNKELTK